MSLDTHQSVYRERLLEHLLLGELLKHSWLHDQAGLEIAQPALDRAGHDVVLEVKGCTRHVQFKSSSLSAATAKQTVHLNLSRKPSGCVIWIRFDAGTLELKSFYFFGGAPREPMPSIEGFPVARHTKGNSAGVKLERPNLRVVARKHFRSINSVPELYEALFGA